MTTKKTPAATPRSLNIVANEKGGVGKSLLSQAIADHATLHDVPLGVAQIDTQARLAKALGRKVLTIAPVTADTRRDPNVVMRGFTPLYSMIEAAGSAHVLIDVGANQAQTFARWVDLVDLHDDLALWGFKTTLWVPLIAEAEAIRQAGYTASLLQERFPNARLVLVENEHAGGFDTFKAGTERAEAYATHIEPLKTGATILRMPADDVDAWPQFQAANCRMIDVATMEIDKVMALTGLPRPEAKITRGDVSGWAGTIIGELDRVLVWSMASNE